jgi:hypothetical protein
MRHTLEALIRYAGTKSRVKSVPSSVAEGVLSLAGELGLSPLGPYHALMYGRSMFFDIGRAEAELGFNPRYGNVEMICESYQSYLDDRLKANGAATGSAHRSRVSEGILRLFSRLIQWM